MKRENDSIQYINIYIYIYIFANYFIIKFRNFVIFLKTGIEHFTRFAMIEMEIIVNYTQMNNFPPKQILRVSCKK